MDARGGYGQTGGGLSSLLSGLFTDPSKAYGQAQNAYTPYIQAAYGGLQPYQQLGQQAMAPYQQALGQMSNPGQFLNSLMSQYQPSQYSQYLQDQVGKAGVNAASASGLIGSTPFLQQQQQNAGNIASGDMQNWLSQALGLNTQYLGGLSGLINTGLSGSQDLANVFMKGGGDMAGLAYGKEAGDQSRTGNLFGGAGNVIGGLLSYLYGS